MHCGISLYYLSKNSAKATRISSKDGLLGIRTKPGRVASIRLSNKDLRYYSVIILMFQYFSLKEVMSVLKKKSKANKLTLFLNSTTSINVPDVRS